MTAEAEFWMRNAPTFQIGKIPISEKHRAEIAELFEKREQAVGLRWKALELHNRSKCFNQATRSCEDIQLMPFDVAFDEFEIGDLEIIQPRERNPDCLVAALFTLDLQGGAAVADPLPGQLRDAAMIGQGGFDRLDVVEGEALLPAPDVTDHLRLGLKCQHLAGLADRARQPKQ